MGADYLSVSMLVDMNGRYFKGDRNSLPEPTEFSIEDCSEALLDEVSFWLDNNDYVDGSDEIGPPAVRAYIADLLRTMCLEGRDTSWTETGCPEGWMRVETGGMSWGDSPTDAYDIIVSIDEFPQVVLDFYGFSFTTPRGRFAAVCEEAGLPAMEGVLSILAGRGAVDRALGSITAEQVTLLYRHYIGPAIDRAEIDMMRWE